ncbi:MAG: hypothetical protein WB586_00435 [Chthoniobacterales bacterium]
MKLILTKLYQNWAFSGLLALLTGAVIVLQAEVNDLKSKLASVDKATASQIEKFERNLFAKFAADEAARKAWMEQQQALAAKQQAADSQAIRHGLDALPTGDMGRTILWKETEPKAHN